MSSTFNVLVVAPTVDMAKFKSVVIFLLTWPNFSTVYYEIGLWLHHMFIAGKEDIKFSD